MIKVSLLGFTTEIKNLIDQLSLPEGGQNKEKKNKLKRPVNMVTTEKQMKGGVSYLAT